jgi:hypothetical protein
MKSLHTGLLLSASLLLALSPARAQLVDIVTLDKLAQYRQTGNTTPTLDTGRAGGPYRFDVSVSSIANNNVSGITAPIVTLPGSATAQSVIPMGHNGGTLIYDGDSEWRYGYPDATGWNVATTLSLNSLFANGAHSITADGHTYTLNNNLNSPGLPTFVPALVFSGGTWSGGKYLIDPSQTLTITTPAWANFTTTGIGGIINLAMDMSGGANSVSFSRLAPTGYSSSGANTVTITVAANTFVAGQDYTGFASFARIVDQDTSVSGVYAVATWGNEIGFTVSAIPEPSTYAAFAGVLALGLAAWRRRSRTA